MKAGKRSIHFSGEWLDDLQELADLLGIRGIYGEIPRALRLGTTLAIDALHRLEEVTPKLDGPELDMVFSSIRTLRKRAKRAASQEKGPDKSRIVTPASYEHLL